MNHDHPLVTGVDFVVIPSNDIDAAREFYDERPRDRAVERLAAAGRAPPSARSSRPAR